MQRSRSPVVAGIESGEEIAHLLPTALAEHQPIRTHAQRLSHETPEVDAARTFQIGLAGLETDHVRMRDAKLGDIFDDDDAFVGRRIGEESREQRRLAGTACSGDQEVRP